MIICTFVAVTQVAAQSNLETFGKSRVQYRKFQWRYFESGRFKIHYYDRGGAELARFVAEQVDQDVRAIERTMNSSFPSHLNIILYNTYTDYLQSNVDFNPQKEIPITPTGHIHLAGDKLVVYFDGQHSHLKDQLRRGLAQVIVERVMFGNDIKTFARNTLSQKIPNWLGMGYIDYTVFGWEVEAEEEVKQLLLNEKTVFEDIVRRDHHLAGKMFWKYIADVRGKQEVRNLFMTILNRNNFKQAIRQKYDMKLYHLNDSIVSHFRERYRFEKTLTEDPGVDSAYFTIKPRNKDVKISQVMVSPRGFDIAYLEWDRGEYRIVMEKTFNQKGTNERARANILTLGIKDFEAEQDINYPIISWSNTGFKLAIVYLKKGKIVVRVYDAIKAEFKNYQIRYNRFDRIQSITFMEEDELIILSAIKNGQSDLFEYKLRTGQFRQLTDDTYDDLSPVYVAGGSRRGIIFMSNRPEPYMNIRVLPNELPTGPMNAYFYNYTTKSDSLMQLTRNNADFMSDVISYGHDHFAYLSSETGIRNRYVILFNRDEKNLDTAYSVPVTNYSSNIVNHQYNPASQKVAEVIQVGEQYKVYFRPMELPEPLGNLKVTEPILIRSVEDKSKTDLIMDSGNENEERPFFRVTEGDEFLNEFSFAPSTPVDDSSELSRSSIRQESMDFAESVNFDDSYQLIADTAAAINVAADQSKEKRILFVDSTYIKMRSFKYFNSFRTTTISARLDNSLLFNRYQSYSGNLGQFSNPDMGGMLTLEMKDRLENHKVTLGGRFGLDGSKAMFLKYDNLTRRLDWGVSGFMSTSTHSLSVGLTIPGQGVQMVYDMPLKSIMNIFQLNFNYPLDRVRSLRAYIALRQDRSIIKATDLPGILIDDMLDYSVMNRFEFIQDNSRTFAMNLNEGMKYKIYGEYLYKFKSQNDFYGDRNGTVNNKVGGFYSFGFDARIYNRVYKDVIIAHRAAGAHAGGGQQIMYLLGGVDNPLNAKYNSLLQPSLQNNYAFQSLATNLRGYPQNARNGNTYFVLNNEIRIPVMSTLSSRPVNSLFLKHLQVVGFLDAGSAWEGLTPLNQPRRENRFYYPDHFNPQTVVVMPYPFNYGIALGYGVGLRMYLWSYLVRVDYARNIDNKGMLHLSLGFDF